MSESIHLRLATMDDAEVILEWVNDPEDRANSFSSDPVSLEEHLVWMQHALSDDSKLLYIMEDDGVPVGHIKLYKDGSTAEVGYCIDPEFRGRGYAKKMIGLLTDVVDPEAMGIKRIRASVKPENIASSRALEANGYKEVARVFELNLPSAEGAVQV